MALLDPLPTTAPMLVPFIPFHHPAKSNLETSRKTTLALINDTVPRLRIQNRALNGIEMILPMWGGGSFFGKIIKLAIGVVVVVSILLIFTGLEGGGALE